MSRTKYKVPHEEVSNRLSQSPMILISPCQHNTILSNPGTRNIVLQNTAIDFSDGVEEPDGTLCVFRPEEKESLEQEQEQQCTRRF